jgi:hypothetical protein
MSLWQRNAGQAATDERATTGDPVKTAGKVPADLLPVGTAVRATTGVPAMIGARGTTAATGVNGPSHFLTFKTRLGFGVHGVPGRVLGKNVLPQGRQKKAIV